MNKKDLHITETLKNQLVDFLIKKTGLEWYYFIKPGEITKNIKPYLLDFARCFSELNISFDNQLNFDTACTNCFEKRGHCRLTFIFKNEEYKIFEKLCKNYNIKTQTYIFFILLTAIVNQNKKYSVNLEKFTQFFLVKGNATPLFISNEIVQKLRARGFNNKRSNFLRKTLFYQIFFGKTEKPDNPDYFIVTPEKTGWMRIIFWANKEIKEYVNQNTFGFNKGIALLNCINTYMDNLHNEN